MQFGESIGEALVPDRRLDRVAGLLRKEYPRLPEEAKFVTFEQPSTYADMGDGLIRPIAAVAVFAVEIPNPRHPELPRLFTKSTWMDTWRTWDRNARHDGQVVADPLYQIYKMPNDQGEDLMVQAIKWFENLKAMLN